MGFDRAAGGGGLCGGAAGGVKQASASFLKKGCPPGEQKTFAHWPHGGFASSAQEQKFFGYFFQKSNFTALD